MALFYLYKINKHSKLTFTLNENNPNSESSIPCSNVFNIFYFDKSNKQISSLWLWKKVNKYKSAYTYMDPVDDTDRYWNTSWVISKHEWLTRLLHAEHTCTNTCDIAAQF